MANILLIEDMKGVRESLAMVLEKGGHQVTQAVTGSEGLDSARAQTPDLVITDILMPDVDGSEVVIALKKGTRRKTARSGYVWRQFNRDGGECLGTCPRVCGRSHA